MATRHLITALLTTVLLVPTSEEARRTCIRLGGDAVRTEAAAFARGESVQLGRVRGCYVRALDLIVCAAGDTRCLSHERAHAGGWEHPVGR
jgi:hypothetical protein